MKKLYIGILGLMVALSASITNLMAQSSNYKLLPESNMVIEGTSTIHDWEADVESINLEADFASEIFSTTIPESAKFIRSLEVTVPVESIESGKGGMNNKIYGALKEKKHPNISYEYRSAELASVSEDSTSFTLNATGDLTVAGNTKSVTFPVTAKVSEGDTIWFEGAYSLNMKDYDVDPPSAMFGTIKAGEEVTIKFNVAIANQAVANSNSN
ncbi:MAG: YceI family protein [Balneolaceae bacterium]|nr:YceI family protein [Balneolaceae bacterium]